MGGIAIVIFLALVLMSIGATALIVGMNMKVD